MAVHLIKNIQFSLAMVSCASMIFAPVHSFANTVDNSTKWNNSLQQTGLNKLTSMDELIKKGDSFLTDSEKAELNKISSGNLKDTDAPKFETSVVKDKFGKEIPVLKIENKDFSMSIKFIGESNKFIQVNNVYMTEKEASTLTSFLDRLMAADPQFRKKLTGSSLPLEIQEYNKKSLTGSNETAYGGMAIIPKEIWKTLSKKDKVQYIIQSRMLHEASLRVIDEIKKDSKNEKVKSSMLENWIFWILQDAEAADSKNNKEGLECGIAGFVSSYDKNGLCSADPKKIQYGTGFLRDENKKAFDYCAKKSSFPCSVLLYSKPNTNNYFCVNNNNINNASNLNDKNSCASQSKLIEPNIQFDKKDSSRYSDVEKILEENYNKNVDGNQKNIEKYLKGFGIEVGDELNDDTYNQLVQLNESFQNDISFARNSCANTLNQKVDKKLQIKQGFLNACDQFHRTQLYIGKYLESKFKCEKSDEFNYQSLKCVCFNRKEVMPGSSCDSDKSSSTPLVYGSLDKCKELGCNSCESASSENNIFKCVDPSINTPKSEPSFWQKITGFFKDTYKSYPYIYWTAGAFAGYHIFKKVFFAKESPAPVSNTCETNVNKIKSGNGCICPNTCALGMYQNSDTCGCTAVNDTQVTCVGTNVVVTNILDCPPANTTTTESSSTAGGVKMCKDGSVISASSTCPSISGSSKTSK